MEDDRRKVDNLSRAVSGLSMFERPGDRAYNPPHRRNGGDSSSSSSAPAPRNDYNDRGSSGSGYGGEQRGQQRGGYASGSGSGSFGASRPPSSYESRDNRGSGYGGNRDSRDSRDSGYGGSSDNRNYGSRDSGSSYGGASQSQSRGGREAYAPPASSNSSSSFAAPAASSSSNSRAQQDFPSAFNGPRSTSSFAPEESGPAGEFQWLPRNKALEETLYGGVTHKTGINFEKYEDIPVSSSGDNCPKAIDTFSESELHPLIKDNVALGGYTNPTPVQKNSIAIVTAGRDLMACAQTGSGKTAAFLMPILSQIFKNNPVPRRTGYVRIIAPVALIMAPTRELAMQIYEEARKFTYRSWVRPGLAYGGQPMAQQLRDMGAGCDLLVATPGRLSDMITRGKLSLAQIRFMVLDEADRMLDMGFEPQIRQIVEGADMPPKEERQTLMFSATFPRDIQILAADFLRDYIFLSVGRVGSTSENIVQQVLWVDDYDKRARVVELLRAESAGLTLIFVETKRGADSLDDFLYAQRFRCTSIHGDRNQSQREDALKSFRSGETNVMVATAVAARGLDIPNVTNVINYDLPTDVDDYVHRIGRTGRAGNVGKATTFFNDANRGIARALADLLKEANQEVPEFLTRGTGFGSSSNPRPGRGFGGHQASRDSRYSSAAFSRDSHGDSRGGAPAARPSFGGGRGNDFYAQDSNSSRASSNGWGSASQDNGRYNQQHVSDSWDN